LLTDNKPYPNVQNEKSKDNQKLACLVIPQSQG